MLFQKLTFSEVLSEKSHFGLNTPNIINALDAVVEFSVAWKQLEKMVPLIFNCVKRGVASLMIIPSSSASLL